MGVSRRIPVWRDTAPHKACDCDVLDDREASIEDRGWTELKPAESHR